MKKKDFALFLLRNGVVKFGEFTLKDGSSSPFFLDFGALATGRSFTEVGRFFYERIAEIEGLSAVDFLYGPPYKASMLAGATAMAWPDGDIPCLFTRKEAKAHGEGGTSFGHRAEKGQSYIMLDDVMSSGGTKLEALAALPGNVCAAVVVGVDRQHPDGHTTAAEQFMQKTGVPVYSLITLAELVEYLDGEVEAGLHQKMKEFCAR